MSSSQVSQVPVRPTGRWLVDTLRTPQGRILAAGSLLVAVCASLALLRVGGSAMPWYRVQWTVAAGAAAAATWAAATVDHGTRSHARRLMAAAMTGFAAAQVIAALEAATGAPPDVGVSDMLLLGAVSPIVRALRMTINASVGSGAERHAVALDTGALIAAIFGIVVLHTSGAFEPPDLDDIAQILEPTFFLGVAAGSMVWALRNRARLSASGPWSIVAGYALLGLVALAWESSFLHPPSPGFADALAVSVGFLLVGLGSSAHHFETDSSAAFGRFVSGVRLVAPLLALGIGAVLTVVSEFVVQGSRDLVIHFAVAAIVLFTGLRQAYLLRDRMRAVGWLQVAQADLLVALDAAELSAEREHRIAEARGKILAASERLVYAVDQPNLLVDVLALLVPHGAIGFVSRRTEDGSAVRVVAVHGPAPDDFLGRETRIAELPSTVADRYADNRPRGYTARGRSFLPAGLVWQDYTYQRVLPRAASTLTLPFVAVDGAPLGSLNLVDPRSERILEGEFLDFARLVANQIAVALQNADLVAQLHAQIDELWRVQDQLVQASRLTAIGELAAAVAHEINNPLTGVLGYADLLLAESPPDDPDREGLEVIRAEALRARSVVWALLDFARPRAPERHPVDLVDLVHRAVDLSRQIGGTGITFVERLEPLPPVELDEGAIQQVLLNLITNACQAIVGTGTVTLTTARDGETAVVTVTDTGRGMDGSVRRRMFEPFYTTKPMRAGGGLGMSVSLGFVESHNGTIRVESEPGRGTTIEVRLPIRMPGAMPSGVVRDATVDPHRPPADLPLRRVAPHGVVTRTDQAGDDEAHDDAAHDATAPRPSIPVPA